MVIQDPTNGKLGVLNLNDADAIKDFRQTNTLSNTSNLEIGLKYSVIRFMEENETFYVKTDDNNADNIDENVNAYIVYEDHISHQRKLEQINSIGFDKFQKDILFIVFQVLDLFQINHLKV